MRAHLMGGLGKSWWVDLDHWLIAGGLSLQVHVPPRRLPAYLTDEGVSLVRVTSLLR